MRLTFRAVPLLPIRLTWLALIPEFTWNDHFCDEQTAGPFHYWLHSHSVRDVRNEGVTGTLVHDRVEYEFPGGPLGNLANLLGGRAQIRYIFRYRHWQTAALMPLFAEELTGHTRRD